MNSISRFIISQLAVMLCLLFVSKNGALGQGLPRNDDNFLKKHLLCALDKGECDTLGKQIKSALPEIIGNNCRSCTPKQKANADKISKYIQTKDPDVWRALVRKYAYVI